jgi:hypothetical protein
LKKIHHPPQITKIAEHEEASIGGNDAAANMLIQPMGHLLFDPTKGRLSLFGKQGADLAFQE